MAVFINPGSGPVAQHGVGWTNTLAKAREYAKEWHEHMKSDGIVDVEMTEGKKSDDGRWVFYFTHKVTGVKVKLEHHGIDDLKAYEKERVWSPRFYWNGSSSGSPEITDWLKDGFAVEQRIVALAKKDGGLS